MNNDLEAKTDSCPFKTARAQCLLLKEGKGSKISDQNFPCNHEGIIKIVPLIQNIKTWMRNNSKPFYTIFIFYMKRGYNSWKYL